MSDTLEKTFFDQAREVKEILIDANNGDHDRFQHYFTKKAIDANLLEGKPMVSICGKVVKQQVDPKGRTICQRCIDIYEGLKE